NGVRFEFPIDAAAERKAFAEAPEKSEDRGGKCRRQADGRQFLEPEFRAAREGKRIDFFFGNEEHDLMPARAQNFRDGQPWKQMSASTSTRDHGIHRIGPIRRIGRIRFSAWSGPGSRRLFSLLVRARPDDKCLAAIRCRKDKRRDSIRRSSRTATAILCSAGAKS